MCLLVWFPPLFPEIQGVLEMVFGEGADFKSKEEEETMSVARVAEGNGSDHALGLAPRRMTSAKHGVFSKLADGLHTISATKPCKSF